MSLPLIIAATAGELAPLRARLEDVRSLTLPYGEGAVGCIHGVQVVLATLGVGKVNTAAGLALAIAELKPRTVVQIGIAGAFADSELDIGEAAVASEEVHLDSGVLTASGFEDMESLGFPLLSASRNLYNRLPVNLDLSRALAASSGLPLLPFGTSETVSGNAARANDLGRRFGVVVESMEGAAAAQVALALRVPFAEVRGVSNFAGERDKRAWRIDEALTTAHGVLEEWLRRGASAEPRACP